MFALRRVVAVVAVFGVTGTMGAAAAAPETGQRGSAYSSQVRSETDAAFTDVSCPTAKFCISVGYRNGAPIARRWNGHTWHAQTTPHRSGSLSSVWCTGKSNCLAVGHRSSATMIAALAERWDGHRWHVVSAANPHNSTSTSLEAVTCRSVRDCVATGSYGERGNPRHPLAEVWDGTSWVIVPSADPPARVTGNDLPAVACTASARCIAVGTRGRGSVGSRVLAETSSGRAWRVTPMTAPGGTAADSALSGVSCSRTADAVCMAVGNVDTGGSSRPLAERWHRGAWHRSHPRARPSDRGDRFGDVACVSATRCLAVGTTGSGTTLTEVWNEHGWKVTPSAAEPGRYNGLQAIACTAPTHCLAVGFDEKPDDSVHPLAELWDGSSWRLIRDVQGSAVSR